MIEDARGGQDRARLKAALEILGEGERGPDLLEADNGKGHHEKDTIKDKAAEMGPGLARSMGEIKKEKDRDKKKDRIDIVQILQVGAAQAVGVGCEGDQDQNDQVIEFY